MKATELRIGNLFEYEKCLYLVDSISKDIVVGKNVNGYAPGNFPLNKMQPIRISEEWLLKFGFELFPWGWIKLSSDDFGLRVTAHFYYEVPNNRSVKIDYIHQLQNLFFTLAGEELKVK